MSNETTIKIPFGKSAMNTLIAEAKAKNVKPNMQDFILGLYIEKLKELDYSEDSIGRLIFESALDHLSGIVAYQILIKLKNHKVPKYIPLVIDRSIPKIE